MSRRFIFKKMQGIRGCLDPGDTLAGSAIITHQNRQQYYGGGSGTA